MEYLKKITISFLIILLGHIFITYDHANQLFAQSETESESLSKDQEQPEVNENYGKEIPAESQAAESQAAESQAAESQADESQAVESQADKINSTNKKITEEQPVETIVKQKNRFRDVVSYSIYAGYSFINNLNYDSKTEFNFQNYPNVNHSKSYNKTYFIGGYKIGAEALYDDFKHFSLGLGLSFHYIQDFVKYQDSESLEPNNIDEFLDFRLNSMWSAFLPFYISTKYYFEKKSDNLPYLISHLGYNFYLREKELHFNQINDPLLKSSTTTSTSMSTSGGLYLALGCGYQFRTNLHFELLIGVNMASFSNTYKSKDPLNGTYVVKHKSNVRYLSATLLASYHFDFSK